MATLERRLDYYSKMFDTGALTMTELVTSFVTEVIQCERVAEAKVLRSLLPAAAQQDLTQFMFQVRSLAYEWRPGFIGRGMTEEEHRLFCLELRKLDAALADDNATESGDGAT